MELEIKVMWCKGLTAFNFFQKLTVYAAVSIISEDERIRLTQDQKQEQKTPVDENGEGNPEWNYPMKFDLRPLHIINPNMNALSLLFELRNPGQFFGDKTIGEVRVPLKDLIQSVGCQVVRFVKYEVRNPEGKHNGILDFSYKVIDNGHGNNTHVIDSNHDVQITGYHHHHHYNDQQLYQSHEQHCTNSDAHAHVTGYTLHHHDQQLNESHTNSEIHIIGSQHYNHDHNHNNNHHLNDTFSTSNSEMIQYPKIDLDEQIPIASALPLVYPPSSSSYYYSSSSSFTSTNATHYQPSASLYPPPSPQTWGPTPPPPSHYPPPPLQQPYIYPPPPLQQQPQPYGNGDTHWGYYRSDSYHQW